MVCGTKSRNHSSSSCDGKCESEIARRNILCGDVRYFESASEGGTGASTGFEGKRSDRWRLAQSEDIERGRE